MTDAFGIAAGPPPLLPSLRSAAVCKLMSSYSPPVTRGTAPRLVAAGNV